MPLLHHAHRPLSQVPGSGDHEETRQQGVLRPLHPTSMVLHWGGVCWLQCDCPLQSPGALLVGGLQIAPLTWSPHFSLCPYRSSGHTLLWAFSPEFYPLNLALSPFLPAELFSACWLLAFSPSLDPLTLSPEYPNSLLIFSLSIPSSSVPFTLPVPPAVDFPWVLLSPLGRGELRPRIENANEQWGLRGQLHGGNKKGLGS